MLKCDQNLSLWSNVNIQELEIEYSQKIVYSSVVNQHQVYHWQLFTEVEVNSGRYLLDSETAR